VKDSRSLQGLLTDLAEGVESPAALMGVDADPYTLLDLMQAQLGTDMDITALERVESAIKIVVKELLLRPLSGEEARRLAAYQQRLGFLFKYKSYTIKCATILGYSIFLHNQGEGFSFQRHVTHKTEIFHILTVKPGGYIFLCEYSDWCRIYEPNAFKNWVLGEPNAKYDQYKFIPAAGDVVVVDKLGTVHTVVGCVLEEYATASTDMVDRLHDQNAGKSIPPRFSRDFALHQLQGVTIPKSTRNVILGSGEDPERSQLRPIRNQWGTRTTLIESFLTASVYHVDPCKQTDFFVNGVEAAMIFVSSGSGSLLLGDGQEVGAATPPSMALAPGESAFIAPGIQYAFAANDGCELAISEQCIQPEIALVT
jgi:hypothetical protein